MIQYSLDKGIESALINEGLLTKDQLTRARRIQDQLAGQKSLSEVLLEMNWVSESRLDDFVRRHRSSLSIGDILMTRRLVTHQDVMAAREVQRKSGPRGKRLGEVLTEMGLIEERHVVEALAEKFGLPLLEPDISQIDIELVRRMSLKDLRRTIGLAVCITDVHLEPMANKLRVRYRIDGVLVHKLDFPRDYTPRIISRIKILADADVAERRKHQDGRIFVKTEKQEIDIRVSFYATVFGENVVLRILNKASLISLLELGFAPNILRLYSEDVLASPSGITLITGPTGSGKTTTLYSSIDFCNDPTVKIITCEDPVEYVIDGISQCSINEKIGLTFNETLRSIVRQDPDIIVIGEIRDRFSADVAVQSALTGHKVFATFHTEDSVGALVRLINLVIETSLIASTIGAVRAQRLVRKVCAHCQV